WGKEMLPLVGKDKRPFPVGYSETTRLPARDGVPGGGVERSAGPPNCSYFTNWTSKKDVMTWDIEVGHAGTYEAEVYYTCPAADIGSTMELTFGDAKVQGKVSEAYDPPKLGAKLDRVPRGESYWKFFKPMTLGKFTLTKSRGKLALRAVEIPGKQVADVRYVTLRRV